MRFSTSLYPVLFATLIAGCSTPGGRGDDDHVGDDDTVGDDDGTPGDDDDGPIGDDDGGGGDDDGGDDDDGGGDDDGTGPDAGMEPDAEPGPDAEPLPPQELAVCATGAAYTTVGAAIAAAHSGDTIRICAGTFAERVVIDGKALALIGAGAGQTILDGGDAGTVVTINAAPDGVSLTGLTVQHGKATAEGGGIRCTSSKLTITASAVLDNDAVSGAGLYANACVLDIGTTRVAGNAAGNVGGGVMIVEGAGVLHDSELSSNTAALRGGGVHSDSEVELATNVIADNTAGWTGGGVHVIGHAPLIHDNQVLRNSSPNDGGGIYLHQSRAIVRANLIQDNVSGDDGGGFRAFESPCLAEANTIQGNHAADSGAGVRVSHVPCTLVDNIIKGNVAGGIGGGLDLDNDGSTVRGGEVSGNTAYGSGGAFHVALTPWSGTLIEDVRIADNTAHQGAAIYATDNFMPLTLRRLTITGNHGDKGGALMISSTNWSITDSLIAGNHASQQGGAILWTTGEPWTEPCTPQEPCPPAAPTGTVDQVVIAGNDSPDGAAIWLDTTGLTVSNSILASNTGGSQVTATAAPGWRYNDTVPATFTGMADPSGGEGNLSVDPAFVGADDYHLASGSPCIDAGDPAKTDPDGTRVDMGLIGGQP